MRTRLTLLLVAITVLAVACSPTTDATTTTRGLQGQDNGPSSDEIAPSFAVETFDGTTFNLDDHLVDDGRPVFLNLWASWCFPCRKEMPAIDAAAANHPEVQFIGVAVSDTEPDALKFVEEIGVSYLLAFDADGSVDDGYAPLGLPASYIISSEGVIVERIFGEVTEESLAEKFEQHFG